MALLVADRPRLAVPPRPRRRAALLLGGLGAVALVAVHVWAWAATDFSLGALATGWRGIVSFLADATPPDLAWSEVVEPGLRACGVTLAIGLLGTTFSIPTSLVLAVLGARTTSRNRVVYQAARGVMSFFRAVPDIVFALIFVTAVGLGPFAGVLALVCHNTGVMAKLWSEAMEELDPGPVDALRVAGASSAQVASHVVLPSVVPQCVGLLLYRFDVNVRSSLVLGLVGAGGVGFLINQSISLFQFDQMFTYILMVLVLVVVVDLASGAVRRRLAGLSVPARAAVWDGSGFAVADVALPALGPGELLVEVELATICGSDLHTTNGDRPTPVPTVLGHEAVGRVVAAGSGTGGGTGIEVGERVTWSVGTSCGSCRRCARGVPQKCVRVRKYGHERIEEGWRLNGALASHVHLLAGTAVVPVPDGLPAPLLAPASCATATVTCAARRVGLEAGDAVAVIGCGMLGLSAVAYAVDRGASRVVACDVDPARRDLAAAFGADVTCPPEGLAAAVGELGADVVLELSGSPAAVTAALDVVGLAGRVALVGSVSPGPSVSLDPNAVVRNLTTVVGTHNYAPVDLVEAVAFLERTPVRDRLTALVSAPYALSYVGDAFAAARSGLAPRVAVRP